MAALAVFLYKFDTFGFDSILVFEMELKCGNKSSL